MLIRLIISTAILGSTMPIVSSRPLADDTPIAPRTLTLERTGRLEQTFAAMMLRTHIPIEAESSILQKNLSVKFAATPFWSALEDMARRTETRIVVRNGGQRITLEPRGSAIDIAFVSGPFRTRARQANARFDLELGRSNYFVQLDAHWEPRLPVFRISAVPQITRAIDDRDTELTATSAKSFTPVAGFHQSFGAVHLDGLTRESKSIAILRGYYIVTAAEQMLAFRFSDLRVKQPATVPPQAGVTASLHSFEKDENVWEAKLELNYPGELPVFESFEEGVWLARNRLELIPPGGGKAYTPDDYQFLQAGKRVVVIYRFKENAATGLVNPNTQGWSAVYRAPSPLREYRVPFELKGIPLP